MEELKQNKKESPTDITGQGPQPIEEMEEIELDGKRPDITMIVGFKDSKKTKSELIAIMNKMTHLKLDNKKLDIVDNL
jgi:hypothetical protein